MISGKCMGIENEYSIYINGQTGAGMESIEPEVSIMINYTRNKYGPTEKFQFLNNGARIYYDIGAPEYSTGECLSPATLVAHDKAGESIIQEAANHLAQTTGANVAVHKKNSDGFGNTYGCHENYSVSPQLFSVLVNNSDNLHKRIWATFLAARQIITGAGKVGSEYLQLPCSFQISQRADFLEQYSNNETTTNRPIIQMRDEPHANPKHMKRFHVIAGDANMCENSTYLKTGLSALMLMFLDSSYFEGFDLPIFHTNILNLFRLISRDTEFKNAYQTEMSKSKKLVVMSILDILDCYLTALKTYLERGLSEKEKLIFISVLEKSDYVLQILRSGSTEKLFGFIDWPTKKILGDKYLAKSGNDWNSCMSNADLRIKIRSLLDMAYTNIDPENSLYYSLLGKGFIKRVVSDKEITTAVTSPPLSRAKMRSLIATRYKEYLSRLDWEIIGLTENSKIITLMLSNPILYSSELEHALTESATPTTLASRIKSSCTLNKIIDIKE